MPSPPESLCSCGVRCACNAAILRLRLELEEERKLRKELVAALPKCDQCDKPALRSPGRGRERRCDDHANISRAAGESFYCRDEYPRAEPLRQIALLDVRLEARERREAKGRGA
jgi:hypothetical protein